MKAYRAKIKNRIPCAGVIGGIVEIPPDTRKGKKEVNRKKVAGVRKNNSAAAKSFLFPLPRQTAVSTCYDNNNVTTPGLIRVLIVCCILVILMVIYN
ncbi:MAG TPA: hypothetical protein VFJ43_06595 [Bacteroidia bacterium]|nr:hypothetical protein [Bacteroidia bacterium]